MRSNFDELLDELDRATEVRSERKMAKALTQGRSLRVQIVGQEAARKAHSENFAKSLGEAMLEMAGMERRFTKKVALMGPPTPAAPAVPSVAERRQKFMKAFTDSVAAGKLNGYQTAQIQARLHHLGMNTAFVARR